MRVNKFPALLIFLLFLSGPDWIKFFLRKASSSNKNQYSGQCCFHWKHWRWSQMPPEIFPFHMAKIFIRDSHTVSFQLRNKTVREALDVIFEGKINYKERGRHIILQKITTKEVSKENEYFLISGYVKDAVTGSKSIQQVFTIRKSCLCLNKWIRLFLIKISQKDKIRDVTLFVNKEKYKDTIVFIRQSGDRFSHWIFIGWKIITYVDSSAIRDTFLQWTDWH